MNSRQYKYSATNALTADTVTANTIVVANATRAAFAVGQPVELGTVVGNTSVFYGRNIMQIDVNVSFGNLLCKKDIS